MHISTLSPQQIKQLFIDKVWNTAEAQFSAGQVRLVNALRISHLVIRDFLQGMITLRAMGLVYTTILALVPLLAVSFSVLKGFGVHNQVEPLLMNLFLPMGEKGIELAEVIIRFVDNTKAGVLGSLGLLLLMYTVVSLLQKIEQAFNATWRVSQNRSLTQRFSNYIAVVLVGPVLLFSALGISASVSNIGLIQDAMQIESVSIVVKLLGSLLPTLLIIGAFTFVYIFVPNTRVKPVSAVVGAIVAGLLWEVSSWVFTAFVAGSTKYTAIYSAFASAIIFFIWLYINWVILLIGANVAFYYQNPARRILSAEKITLSNRLKENIALNIMLLVARHYHGHKPAWSVEALAHQLHIDADVCHSIILQLCNTDLLQETAEEPPRYLPAYDIETLSLYDIIEAVRAAEENSLLSLDSIHREPSITQIDEAMNQALAQCLHGQSLKDLALAADAQANPAASEAAAKPTGA
ncbi:MAG TPA: YihY/virulence factor BrkB family protein [Gammaproteobacteria bacterium]